LKVIVVLFFLVYSFVFFAQQFTSEKTRLVILADMGNEPDEEQQMMLHEKKFTSFWK